MLSCILSFNHPQLTIKCVEAALQFIPEEKLLLTHNGSQPENILSLKAKFPKIEHLIVEKNRGYTAGANASLRHIFSKSDWAFFITNDCLLASKPRQPLAPGLYAPTIYRRSLNKIDSIGGSFNPLTGKLMHLRTSEVALQTMAKAKNPALLKKYFYVPGTAFYLDKYTFSTVGDFDESLHTYWEDVDYSLRTQKAQLNLGICLDTHLIHKVGKTCHKDPYYTKVLFKNNRKIVSARHISKWLKPLQSLKFGIEK